MSPDSWHTKQWYICFFGTTEKLRCWPPWNGHGPRQSAPVRLSSTCSPISCTRSAASLTCSMISGAIMRRWDAGGASWFDGEFLADNLVDQLAVRPALECRHHLSHHGAHVLGAGRYRVLHRGADLRLTHGRRQVLLQRRQFRRLAAGEVGAAALRECVDGFPAPLDRTEHD